MPRLPFRIAMFLSSYSPLFALMAYENRDSCIALGLLIGASILGMIGLGVVMRVLAGERGPRIEVRDTAPKDAEVLSYIAAYLIPFLAVDLTKTEDVIVFCAFLTILGIVYVNSNLIFVNPLLSLAGYHPFEITDKNGHRYTLIIRNRGIDPDTTLRPAHVDRYLRVDARWRSHSADDTDRDS